MQVNNLPDAAANDSRLSASIRKDNSASLTIWLAKSTVSTSEISRQFSLLTSEQLLLSFCTRANLRCPTCSLTSRKARSIARTLMLSRSLNGFLTARRLATAAISRVIFTSHCQPLKRTTGSPTVLHTSSRSTPGIRRSSLASSIPDARGTTRWSSQCRPRNEFRGTSPDPL